MVMTKPVQHLSESLVFFYSLIITCTISHDELLRNRPGLENIPSVFPSRLVAPGLNEPRKAWWAKEITPFLHVCGRLSERQIKYAAEAGFKSIVSLFLYPDDCPGDCGGEYLPVTTEEKSLVEDIAKLQFVTLLDPLDEWSSVEAVEKFTSEVLKIEKPALLHCDRGYTIAFVALLYLANQTRYDPSFEPKIHSKEFYEIAASMGLDFFSRIPIEVVAEVTGEPEISLNDQTVPRPNFHPVEWLDYWFAHPVYYNWFSAGQIYRSHMEPLRDFGYRTILNVRSGVVYDEMPNQEEVNLLNVKSKTGTYGHGKIPQRQSLERLEATRLHPHQSSLFISQSSLSNYEQRNEHEFGDSVGYNETLERQAVQKSGLQYFHIPLHDSLDDFPTYIAKNKDTLLEIGKKGPVLIHCDSGHRSALVSVLIAALQYDLSLDWALQRLKEMSYGISPLSQPHIHNVFLQYLGDKKRVEL